MMPKWQCAAGTVLLLAGSLAGLGGCDEAGKKPMQARVPALSPNAVAAANQNPATLPELPLSRPTDNTYALLLPGIPSGKDYLIRRVEEKFAAGEQNYKAGHLEAARKDFDDAVDWMLESGYDPNSDPKLSELFHRVVDTIYTYELQAFRAGDGFQE